MTEPLPRGANFVRAKTLWEIGLHIAGNPMTPYGGNRDMVITVGSGSGAHFRPSLRLATGSAILARDVADGGVDLAFVNPSALLSQAYRGVGLFPSPLPVRIIAVYPSWDRFVFMVHPRTGIRSLRDLKAKRYPLRISVREDPTHSTLVLIEQARAARFHAARHRVLGRAPRRLRLASEGTLSPPAAGCRYPRFQRLANLCERSASGKKRLRCLRGNRRARSGDPVGEGHRRRETDGA
jgi:hypothetical protein